MSEITSIAHARFEDLCKKANKAIASSKKSMEEFDEYIKEAYIELYHDHATMEEEFSKIEVKEPKGMAKELELKYWKIYSVIKSRVPSATKNELNEALNLARIAESISDTDNLLTARTVPEISKFAAKELVSGIRAGSDEEATLLQERIKAWAADNPDKAKTEAPVITAKEAKKIAKKVPGNNVTEHSEKKRLASEQLEEIIGILHGVVDIATVVQDGKVSPMDFKRILPSYPDEEKEFLEAWAVAKPYLVELIKEM